MLDTIAVTFPVELKKDELMYWPFLTTRQAPWGRFEEYTQNTVIENTTIKATYNPPSKKYPEPRLKLEASLPIASYGNNVVQFTDLAEVHAGALLVNRMLEEIPGIPKVDMRDGELNRLDLCCNHQVGNKVHEYIRALFDLNYPHRETRPYPNGGVQYMAKHTSTKFYSKHAECKAPEAMGILRQESTIRKNYYIGRKMEVSAPTLHDVTSEWIAHMLKKDLHNLHIDQQTFCPRPMALEMLIQKYGRTKGYRLYGYLIDAQTHGREQMSSLSTGSIRRNDKLIADAGVALACIDAEVPLPALRVRWEEQNVRGCSK